MEPENGRGSKVKQRLREKANQLDELLGKIELEDRQHQEPLRPKKVVAPKAASSTAPKVAVSKAGTAKAAAEKRAPLQPKAEPPRRCREGPPIQKFEVIQPEVAVHKWPEEVSSVVGWKRRGDRLEATEETFDGWARLTSGEGWILRERQEPGIPLRILEPIGVDSLLLAAPLVAKEPGRQMFEVVGGPEAPVLTEPVHGATIVGVKAVGEVVLAETQSYHGWLRLPEGWLPAASQRGEALVRCLHREEEAARLARREQLAEERAREAAAEEEVELSIERARQSDIWRRLQDPVQPSPIKGCDRLPLRPEGSFTDVGTMSSLPLQEFRVLPKEGAVVRQKPNNEASVCGVRREGELILAGEETFNGGRPGRSGPAEAG